MILFVILLISFFLGMLILNFINSKKKKMVFMDHPFECGISSNSSSRKPYSMPFFFYSLVFLMFDLEIILIYPLIYFFKFKFFYFIYCVLILLLLLSLLYEWMSGSMKWN